MKTKKKLKNQSRNYYIRSDIEKTIQFTYNEVLEHDFSERKKIYQTFGILILLYLPYFYVYLTRSLFSNELSKENG